MLKLPKHVQESAQRIADNTGVSVAEVVRRFSVAVKKSSFTRSDFFWGNSDITTRERFSARAQGGQAGAVWLSDERAKSW